MTRSRHPAFVKLSPKFRRAEREMEKLEAFIEADTKSPSVAIDDWARTSLLAFSVHNIYNGIEDVMQSITNDIDDFVPTGASLHQDLIDQLSEEIPSVRPAVIDDNLYRLLSELKSFRHLVQHGYEFDLDPANVRENVDNIRVALPMFISAVERLEQTLLRDDDCTPGLR